MLVNGRWATIRRLGGGGMGEVYLARDRHQAQRELALKILRADAADPAALERFRDEFRSLARLRHPNLAEVFDFGRVEGNDRPFLTMEFVDGRALDDIPRPEVLQHFEDLAVQCLRALDYIHARGWLHNDIKPQNILVAAPFLVKLLDFGLAQRLASGAETGTSGTLHYLAPERLTGAAADSRSDLYSLGVVLYELLTGRRPFQGPTPGSVVTAILQGGAASPRTLDPSVPARWDLLVTTLLEREPDRRPATAEGALALLTAGASSPMPLDTPETFASWVASGRLVGRETDLAALQDLAAAHAATGDGASDRIPRLALVSGPPGSGKSRLVREFVQGLQLEGVATIAARCHETGGALQPFADLLHAARAARSWPAGIAAVLDHALGRRGPAAATRTPGTASRPGAVGRSARTAGGRAGVGTAPAPPIDKAEMLAGLADALDRMASDRPGVLVLEDLQWADAAAVDLLEHLLLRPSRPRWLLIGTLRESGPAEAESTARLRRVLDRPGLPRLVLKPLDATQTADLIASMLPFDQPPRRLADLLVDKTEGAPLHVEEMLKALFAEGLLARRGATWTVPASLGADLPLPPSLAGLVLRRVASLPEPEALMAKMLAVLARPASLALLTAALASLAGRTWTPERTRRTAKALADLGLVTLDWEADGGPYFALAQNTVRAAVYDDLPAELRRALHRAAATAIEAHFRGSRDEAAEDLATHYAQCGDDRAAVENLLRAARRAESLHNPLGQAGFLRRALDLMPPDDRAARLEALENLCAATLAGLGDHHAGLEVATRLLMEARKARSRVHEARALRHQSWALGFTAHPQEALAKGRKALRMARDAADPRELAASLTYFGIALARGGNHLQARDHFAEATPLARALGDPVLLTWVLNNASLCLMGLGEAKAASDLLGEALEVARRHGLTGAYHRYLANLGLLHMDLGDLPSAITALEEACAWSRRHTTLELTALQCELLATAHALRGRFDRAISAIEESVRARALLGSSGREPLICDLQGQCERALGRLRGATALHEEGLAEARRRSDRTQEGYLGAALAADHLAAGQGASARRAALPALRIARDLPHPRIRFLAERVLAELAIGSGVRRDIDEFRGRLSAHEEKALRFSDRLERHLVLGALALAAGDPVAAESEARSGLRGADPGEFRDIARRLRGLLARTLEGRGLPREARAVYDEANALVEAIASEIEDSAMRDDYRRHAATGDAGAPGAGQERDRARPSASSAVPPAIIPAEAPRRPDSLDTASRMLSTLFEITQVINSIHDPDELLNKVMDLALEMVGAERGLIFLSHDETDDMELVVARNVERQTIHDATAYSRGILKEVGRGRSVLSHDAEHDARFRDYRSVLRYRIRSLMCVPLNLRGRTIGTVYVDTRAPGVVFTPDHLKFLESFAAQAAIAVENARLFDRVRKENENLRQAVNERYGFENIVGRSAKMRDIYALLARIAPSGLPVLIRGESGTGKELVARAIHQNSPRRDKAFFSENCAALPDTLLESELFGHVRGAFTGADTARRGVFEMADAGTLFLDEIGDMSMALQSKLLRALQNGEIRPLGSESVRKVNVRVISATNRDLEAMIRARQFREDLYYRLKGISVTLPPLRDRREDVALLVDHFLGRVARENNQPRLRVEPALMRELSRKDWPGNVRELENSVYRLALFAENGAITMEGARHDLETSEPPLAPTPQTPPRPMTRGAFRKALAASKGNRNEAARLLGISRATFFRRMRQLGVEAPRKNRRPPGSEPVV